MHYHSLNASDAGAEAGLRFALLLPPGGAVRELDWAAVEAWRQEDGFLWVHLERDDPATQQFLYGKAGLDPLVSEALLEDASRPRVEPVEDDLLVVLRGINHTLGDGEEAVELVPLHIWAEADRCLTLRDKAHALEALRDLRLLILAGKGPRKVGPLLARITEQIVGHLGEMTEQIEERLCEHEEAISQNEADADSRQQLNEMRRQIVRLRRYVAPQREALYRLRNEDCSWLCDDTKARLREVDEKLRGHLDNLDEMRQRAALLHEELGARVAEQTNRNTLLMSIVSVIMLPMTFVTGYFGMNTGGLPFSGEASPNGTMSASWLIVAVGLVTVAGTWLMLRRRG
jgi:zinc transporter